MGSDTVAGIATTTPTKRENVWKIQKPSGPKRKYKRAGGGRPASRPLSEVDAHKALLVAHKQNIDKLRKKGKYRKAPIKKEYGLPARDSIPRTTKTGVNTPGTLYARVL